ncbi:MAG: FAD-dependent protein [Eubacterium ramulus]
MRVEHPRDMINESQYGRNADMTLLPTAAYKSNASVFQWKRCIFFLYVPGWLCGECIFRRRPAGSQRHELP